MKRFFWLLAVLAVAAVAVITFFLQPPAGAPPALPTSDTPFGEVAVATPTAAPAPPAAEFSVERARSLLGALNESLKRVAGRLNALEAGGENLSVEQRFDLLRLACDDFSRASDDAAALASELNSSTDPDVFRLATTWETMAQEITEMCSQIREVKFAALKRIFLAEQSIFDKMLLEKSPEEVAEALLNTASKYAEEGDDIGLIVIKKNILSTADENLAAIFNEMTSEEVNELYGMLKVTTNEAIKIYQKRMNGQRKWVEKLVDETDDALEKISEKERTVPAAPEAGLVFRAKSWAFNFDEETSEVSSYVVIENNFGTAVTPIHKIEFSSDSFKVNFKASGEIAPGDTASAELVVEKLKNPVPLEPS